MSNRIYHPASYDPYQNPTTASHHKSTVPLNAGTQTTDLQGKSATVDSTSAPPHVGTTYGRLTATATETIADMWSLTAASNPSFSIPPLSVSNALTPPVRKYVSSQWDSAGDLVSTTVINSGSAYHSTTGN
jgi:hypothetical protein